MLYALVRVISKLPLRVLYVLSDCISFLLCHVVRYRRSVVRDNLLHSLQELSQEELRKVERRFYSYFADYIVETVKACSMPMEEMRRRMEFAGVEEMVRAVEEEGKSFGFVCLAHYGNWEWVASLSMHVHQACGEADCGHIYHPLRNKAFDKLMLRMRGRFGGDNIPMKETLRYVVRRQQQNRKAFIGFISDQAPKWNSIHHWTDFLHRKTPVFTGVEQIGKRVDALIFYADVQRISRGHYRCTITRLVDDVKKHKDYEVTDAYFTRLEQTIRRDPAIWLWTHKRWKRTYEEYVRRSAASQGIGNKEQAQPEQITEDKGPKL